VPGLPARVRHAIVVAPLIVRMLPIAFFRSTFDRLRHIAHTT
jgi:hypothetical protein